MEQQPQYKHHQSMGDTQSTLQTSHSIPTNRDLPVQVQIDYCNSWDYYEGARKVGNFIKQFYPLARVNQQAIEWNSGCFEIYVNEKLIHSKKSGDGFVENGDEFLMKVKQAAETTKWGTDGKGMELMMECPENGTGLSWLRLFHAFD